MLGLDVQMLWFAVIIEGEVELINEQELITSNFESEVFSIWYLKLFKNRINF